MLSSGILLACLAWTVGAASPSNASYQGTLHRRNFFYVGGSFLQLAPNSTFVHGQMYVEHLTPAKITKPYPLVFIEGQGMTGTNLLNTPDGRVGWADHFLSKGYELYLVDQPARARSPWLQGVDSAQSGFNTTYVEAHFTASEKYILWPQAHLHTQWPGNGSLGDPTFEQFYKSTHPSVTDGLAASLLVQSAGTALLDKIGNAILISHSQSGQFGWLIGDANPAKVKGIIALEPTGGPFTDEVFIQNLTRPDYGITIPPVLYDPPLEGPGQLKKVIVTQDLVQNYTCYKQADPPRKLVNLAKFPILMVTSESSFHAVYDGCTADYLTQAGVDVQHIRLENVGIHGNGHMMFMEKNNIQIAEEVVEKWLDKTFHS